MSQPNNHLKHAMDQHEAEDVFSDVRRINSLKAKSEQEHTLAETIANKMMEIFGSTGFLAANMLWFGLWLVINTDMLPGVVAFDPFPFGLLTTIVSLEAIVLSIFVLIAQNHAERVADVRQKVDLEVNLIAEKEMTKLLLMVSMLLEKQGIDISQDSELQAMLRPTNIEKLERGIEDN